VLLQILSVALVYRRIASQLAGLRRKHTSRLRLLNCPSHLPAYFP